MVYVQQYFAETVTSLRIGCLIHALEYKAITQFLMVSA